MLTITIPGTELFDEETETFTSADDGVVLQLEHSLVSLSKWESIHQVPFLKSAGELTPAQVISYLECMVVSGNPEDLSRCTQKDLDKINAYINSTESATTFGPSPNGARSREVVTAELIYYWLTVYSIPLETENWHLNRLFSLIRIANVKNSKPKKMSPRDAAMQARALNDQRRQQLNTRG